MSTAAGPQLPATPEQSQEPPVARRRRGTWVDMLRTMLVVLAFVVLIVLLVPRPGQLPRPKVDVPAAVTGAESQIGFRPVVPAGLPAGWAPTAVETRNGAGVPVFHIGYLTADGLYAGVDEAASITPEWLDANAAGGKPAGDVTIDGVTWQRLYSEDQQYTSLLLRRPRQVILVTTKQGGIETASVLARSLRLAPS